MPSPLIDYLRSPLGLGPKVIAASNSTKPADAPWLPSSTPGVTIRTGKDGRMQTNGEALMVDKDAPAAPAKKDPPYLPEGFAEFEYHSANGKVAKYVRPDADDAVPEQAVSVSFDSITGAALAWCAGPPPSVGWFNARDEYDREHDASHFVRYWDGAGWRHWSAPDFSFEAKLARLNWRSERLDIQWRGARLAGDDWPELSA